MPTYTFRGITYANYDAAIRGLSAIIARDANDVEALAHRGEIYRAQGKLDDVLADYNQVLQLNPNSAFALARRGEIYRTQGKLDEALADLNKALRLNPKFVNAQVTQAHIFLNLGDLEKALEAWGKVLVLDPKFVAALYQRGLIYYRQRQWQKALASYDEALKIDPDHEWALNGRSKVHYAMGNEAQGLQDKRAAMRRATVHNLCHEGYIYYRQRQWQKALASYDKALKIAPNHSLALSERSKAHYAMGNEAQGLQDEMAAMRLRAVPSLKWLAKQAFFKGESKLVTTGQFLRPQDTNKLRQALASNHITPVTLSLMRTQLNDGKQINCRTIFDDLAAIDAQRAVAPSAESARGRKRLAEDDAPAAQPVQQRPRTEDELDAAAILASMSG